MARVRTLGFEAQGFSSNASEYSRYFEGFTTGAVTSATSPVRTAGGTPAGRSLKCDSGGGNAAAHSKIWIDPSVQDGGAWTRCYFRFESNLPSASSTTIMLFLDGAGASDIFVSARLTSGGKLQLWNETGTPAQIGSDSLATLVADTWYRIELKCLVLQAGDDTVELRLDGVSVASATLALATSDPVYIRVGFVTAPGANRVCYLDDFASNDNTGSDQTAFPGEGNVVLLLPVSDNTVGSWTGGSGGTTDLFEAINNTPPAGTDSESNTTQVENEISGGGTNYVANMTSYSSAGIGAGDTITLVQLYVEAGEDTSGGFKTGTAKIASNPTGSFPSDGLFGTPVGSGAIGVWPINWGPLPNLAGETLYGPSVTLGTAPTAELHRTTASIAVVSVCFMGIYVEYTPGAPASAAGPLLSSKHLLGILIGGRLVP